MQEKKLRVAIIGCGRISVMHVVSSINLKQCELVAVCDKVIEKAQKYAEQYNLKAYSNYEEMIEREDLDAVHICLPHYLHVPVSMYALSKGVNVLTEKPMSIDLESAIKVIEYAKQLNLLYGVISQCRYNRSSRLVKNAITSGKLGKIKAVLSILTWSRPEQVYYVGSEWKGTWDKAGGGVVIDQAIHSIDLVNWLVDSEFESVSCSLSTRLHKIIEVEDSAEGLITYKNGVKYAFYCINTFSDNLPIQIKLDCENGKVVFGYDDARIEYKDGTVESCGQKDNLLEYEGGKDYWGFQHIEQINQFYNACLGLEPLEISGEESLKTHKLIFEIYKQGIKQGANK